MNNKKETKIDSKIIFKGRVITVHEDNIICANGNKSTRECVDHRGGAAILVIHEGKVFLVKQFRYVYQEEIYEIPAGKLEINEDPYDTAKRELEEETGYKTDKLELLGVIYPTPGYTNEKIYIYLATNLVKSEQKLDFDESLDVVQVDYDEYKKMILDGRIKDAKSIAALTFYEGKKK